MSKTSKLNGENSISLYNPNRKNTAYGIESILTTSRSHWEKTIVGITQSRNEALTPTMNKSSKIVSPISLSHNLQGKRAAVGYK
jgi:hypothetical protein